MAQLETITGIEEQGESWTLTLLFIKSLILLSPKAVIDLKVVMVSVLFCLF